MGWGHLLSLGADASIASFVTEVVLELCMDLCLSRRSKKDY